MIAKYVHMFSHKNLHLNELLRALTPLGLSPVFATARNLLFEELSPFELRIPQVFDTKAEAFSSPDHQKAVLARTSGVTLQNGSEVSLLDLVLLSREQPLDSLIQAITQKLGLELLDNSYREETLIERVRGRVTATGPNGKLLEDQAVIKSAAVLEDDHIREQLKEVCITLGPVSIPRSELEKLPSLTKAEDIDELIRLGALVRNFQLHCKSCQTSLLVFAEFADAENNLRNSVKCPCGRSRLQILETFALDALYQRVLQQGLWLEALVSGVVDSRSCRQWAGRMLGTDEIDVICVIANRIIMFECKDKSFGQNDLYVAAVKAQRLRADMVVIISTHRLHSNVYERIEQLNAGREGEKDDKFVAISSPHTTEIKGKLFDLLNKLRRIELTNWLDRNGKDTMWLTGIGSEFLDP